MAQEFFLRFLYSALLTMASYKQKARLSISNMRHLLHNDILLKSCRMEAKSPLKKLCVGLWRT